ncbi:MAG: SUMF1/EgtB/PvdO family nonheme iron enzyme, partial [Magnetococcales bacterium]|nr:SUMF1/EgtB/PvdO family nonheme iron enzyme [Magnetococcales bacterium]
MEEEEQSQLDHRSSQRISLQQPVVVKLDSGLVVRGKTVNVSKGGFFVVDPDTAPMIFKGEKGSITLTHEEESHTFPCMVAWTRDDGFGITVLEDKRKFTRLVRDLVRWKLDQRLSRLNHMRQEVDQIMGFGTLYRFAKWVSVVVSLSVLVVAGVIYSYFGEGLAVMPIHHMGRMEESVQIKEYPFSYTKSLSLLLPGQTIFIHGKVEWLDWLVVSREDQPEILGYIPASTSITRLLQQVDTPLLLPMEEKSKPAHKSSKQPPAQPEVGEEWYHPSGITFVWIPSGMGFMGQGTLEKEELQARYGPALVEYLYSDETPVFLSMPGFWMGKHEVTEAQYRRFIRESGYISRSELAGGCQTLVDEEWSMGSGVHWRKTGLNSGPDYP